MRCCGRRNPAWGTDMAIGIKTDKDRPADPQALSALGQRLLADWTDLRDRRQPIDNLMLADHYQYRSEYSPEEQSRIKGIREDACHLFLGLTRTKVRTLDARINEMAFGAAKKNWSVQPTPEPDLPPDAIAEAEKMGEEDSEAARMSPEERLRMVARARAERMNRQMEDYLVESDYEQKFLSVTHNGHKLRAGILKGPLVTYQMRKRWGHVMVAGEDGAQMSAWRMAAEKIVRPYFEAVKPWDIYLEWTARKPEESEWIFQRHLFGRARIASLAANETFYQPTIASWLEQKPSGDCQWENWETRLYQSSRANAATPADRRKWELIEGWGPLTAEELLQLGMESRLKRMGIVLDDVSAALLEAHPWFDRAGHVIGLSLNPNEDESRPYTFYIPMPDDDMVLGTSFPESIRDMQSGANGTFRMLFDNAASAVGPQVEVRMSRLLMQGDLKRMTPFTIWPTREEPWNSANPAIQFSEFSNHTAVYLALLNALQVLIDEVSGVPRYQHGAGAGSGAGRTASGLAMLMGAAGQLVKDQLRAWDEFQGEVLRKLFNWTMQFCDRPEIKGDARIQVKTSLSVLQKVQELEQLRAFRLSTTNPVDAPFTKRREMLEDEASALGLDPARAVKTKEDMEAEMAMMAAQQQQVLDMQQQAGMPGAAPEGPTGQPPAPAPGAAAGIPPAPPMASQGGFVNETLGDVVGRLNYTPAANGGRVNPHPAQRPQPPVAGSPDDDVLGIERDYSHLLGAN